MKEKLSGSLALEIFRGRIEDAKAGLQGAPISGLDKDGIPVHRYFFKPQGEQGVALVLTDGLFPHIPSPNGSTAATEAMLEDFRRKENIPFHVKSKNQDSKHILGVEFLVANWSTLVQILHPNAGVGPIQTFVEVEISQGKGAIDFVGTAPDGTVFVAEVGRGGKKHSQLKGYLIQLSEIYSPDVVGHIHPFVLNTFNQDDRETTRLRLVRHNPFSTGSPANGDQPRR